jgi:flagellar basal body-associated protein FliL
MKKIIIIIIIVVIIGVMLKRMELIVMFSGNHSDSKFRTIWLRCVTKQEKLKPEASTPGAKQHGNRPTKRPTDQQSNGPTDQRT